MRSVPLLAALLLVAGCGALPQPGPSAALPPDAVQGAGDPTRAAVSQSSFVLAHPAQFAGRPGDAARALANLEYLASALPDDPRHAAWGSALPGQLGAGRDEMRRSLGVAGGAPSQLVIDGFYDAARALRVGDRIAAERALSAPAFTAGGAETLRRLENLPVMPAAATAANLAAQEMSRSDRADRALR